MARIARLGRKGQNAMWVGVAVPSEALRLGGESAASMYCLLCHEKIPRLRAWRTKSEFCCDEHAALYKKQTLERLLVDTGAGQNGRAELPEPPEPDDFESEEIAAADPMPEPLDDDSVTEMGWRKLESDAQLEDAAGLPLPASEDEHGGMESLWGLAGDRREPRGWDQDAYKDVRHQSAEDALAALRSLASRASTRSQEPPEPARPAVFQMPASSSPPPEPAFDEASLLDEIHSRPMEREPAEDRYSPLTSLHVRNDYVDNDAPSVLDELMEDPLQSWRDSRDQHAGRPSPEAPLEAEEALRELVGSFEQSEAAEAIPPIELDAPDPDWDFDQAAPEISALNESLAASGSPAMPFLPAEPADLDVSPEEPAWDELGVLDIEDADLEPPEPEVDEEPPVRVPAAATPQPQVAAEVQDAPPLEAAAPVRRSAGPRFRPVTVFVEIPLTAAWAEGAGRAETPPAAARLAEIAEPAPSQVSTPAGLAHGLGRRTAMSMCDASVELEPLAALESAGLEELGQELAPAPAPFEPGGLFLDLTGTLAETGAEAGAAAGGRSSEP